MSIKTLAKDRFALIAYKRENFGDFVEFKKALDEIVSQKQAMDIALDFTPCPTIMENEMALIASTIKSLLASHRCLRLIVNAASLKKLQQNHMLSMGNVKVYENHASFLSDINSAAATSKEAAPAAQEKPG
jgi:flagellar hook-associated protein FlgK